MYICFWKLCTEKQQEKTKNKNWLCISRMCRICRCTLSSWKKLKLQKAVASNVEEAERTQRRGKPAETKHCDCDWDELAEGEINWQRVKERAQTTARKLHFLKRLPWMSGVWCVHLNRIFTGHKLFFFFLLETKEKNQDQKSNFVIIRSAELSGQRSCFQDSIFVAQWAEIILHFGAKPC